MGSSGEIVKSLYDAFAEGDVSTVLGAFDAKIEWREAEGFLYADGNPYVGPESVAQGVFQRIVSDVAGFLVIPENIIDAGDTVVVEGRYKGKMNSTGRPVDAQFAHVWQFRGGKVIRFQQYTDTAQWARAVGS
jgi:uncharacterized protein